MAVPCTASQQATTGADFLHGAGVVVAFAANQLPSPHIAVSIAGEPARPTLTAEARQTLKPTFDASHSQVPSLSCRLVQSLSEAACLRPYELAALAGIVRCASGLSAAAMEVGHDF